MNTLDPIRRTGVLTLCALTLVACGAFLGVFTVTASANGDSDVAGCVDAGLDGHTCISNICDGFIVKYDANGNKL